MACTPKKSLDPARVPMCALAKKVTPVKKTGNTASDMDAQLKRQSMVELLNVADAFPDHIDAVVRYFTERVRKEQQAGGVDGERFDEVTTLGRIDDAWFCVFLASHSQMTNQEVAKHKSFDTEGIKQVLIYCLGTSLQLKLPAECVEKRVLNLACSARYNELGSRLRSWKVDGGGVFANGRIDWGKMGVYSLTVVEKMVHQITHTPTGATADVDISSGFCVFDGWGLKSNWSDMGAKVAKGDREQGKYFLHTFFAKDEGPHKVKQMTGDSPHFKIHVASAMQQVEKASKGFMDMQVVEDAAAMKGALQERHAAQGKRAREALQRRKEESSSKRRICVAGAVTTVT